jgi:hypothetical protein
MQSQWLEMLERVLRPERPLLDRCLEARDRFLTERQCIDEARARAIAACEQRIHEGRAAVFAANDGVVPARMTELEREWRRLSRRDPDEQLMDLWARMAPRSWHDCKRWRHGAPGTRCDLAVALAADVAGVEAAVAAARELREALATWGVAVGPRIEFRLLDDIERDITRELLAAPLQAAADVLATRGDEQAILSRMAELAREIREAAATYVPDREQLAASIAHAAFVGGVLQEAGLCLSGSACRVQGERRSPVGPLCAIWGLGYVPAKVDALGITLELPPP